MTLLMAVIHAALAENKVTSVSLRKFLVLQRYSYSVKQVQPSLPMMLHRACLNGLSTLKADDGVSTSSECIAAD